jgi:hypothetical protein
VRSLIPDVINLQLPAATKLMLDTGSPLHRISGMELLGQEDIASLGKEGGL